MKTYINSLNDREKWMVIGAGICIAFWGYYMLLYAPLHHRVQQKQEQLVEKADTLKWMNEVKKSYQASKPKQTLDNNRLLSVLDQKLKQDDVFGTNYQLQQSSSGDIQLSFDEVPFKLFMEWINELNKQYQFKIKQLEASQTKTQGVVRLNLTLSA